ncbi:MAG: hypothetical protein RL380_1206, partial [Verrucomicrobiota bacterium]
IAATVATNIATYSVVVSNNAGTVTSANAALIVNSTMTTTTLAPANAATSVGYDTPLYVTFSQTPLLRNVGTIKIFNATNAATPVETIDASLISSTNTLLRTAFPGDAQAFYYFPVVITGNTVAIYPHSSTVMTSNQNYYVTIDNGTFTDTSSNYFVGITASNVWNFTTKVSGPANPTNVVVNADGSGDFITVQGAVDSVAANSTSNTLINVRNGTYLELINISKRNITLRGQSRTDTILKYANNANIAPSGSTHARMSFKVNGNDIAIETLTITNSTPQGGSQAEALMIEGNSAATAAKRCIINNCTIASRQDTILANINSSQAYFNNSAVLGNFDYIWGGGNLFFTNCEIRTISGTSTPNLAAPRTDAGVTGNWPGYLGLNVSNGFAFVRCALTRESSAVTNCTMSGSNGTTNGNSAWIFCTIDTNCYVNANATAGASQLLWQFGNSNATASAAVSFGNLITLSNDTRLTAVTNATTWLNGWTPALAPNITTQPVSTSGGVGENTTFTVTATGIPDPTYQWQFNGTDISGATGTSLTLNTLSNGNAGNYTVIAANASGSVTSSVAALTVVCTTVGISTNPVNQSVSQGATATFTVSATGSARTYQWEISTDNGSSFNPISGATSASYTTPATTLTDSGSQYRVVVSVACDSTSATSTAATNTVTCYAAALTSNPSDQYVSSGASATFTVGATGSLLTYQWQLSTDNGGSYNNVTDATNASYTTPAATGSDNGNKYLCTVTAACGSPTNTTAAKLNVIANTTTAFRSAATGNWNATTTWELSVDNGSTWVAATLTPTSANNTNITIFSPHTVTVTANVSADQLTVQSGATNVVNSGITFTIVDGSGTDMSVGGVVKNAGTVATTGTVEFTGTGKYQHNFASITNAVLGVIPTATWNVGSTCEVIGFTNPPSKVIWGTNATHGLSQAFYNFTWNCPNQATSICIGSVLTNVAGDFNYIGSSTAGGVTSLGSTVAGVNYQLVVGGNFTISGTAKLLSGSSTSSTNLMNVGGDFTIASGGTFDTFGNATNILRFTKAGTQVFTRAGSQLTGASLGYKVDASSTLILSNTVSVTNLDFVIDGTVIARATLSAVSPAKVRANGTGKYQHDLNGSAIPTGVWSATSTCEILGVTTTVPTVSSLGQVFGNFTWNCAAQSAPVSFASTSFTNTGNFRLQNCNASEVSLATTTAATGRIEGNLSVENGSLVLAQGTGIPTVTVLGNATISSGATLKLAASTGNPAFTVGGSLTNSGTYSAAVVAATTATKASVTGNVEFGGALVFATNATPTAGTSFDLFDAASFSGSFASTTLASPLPSGQNWYVGNLSTDGSILLNRAPTPANPTVSRASGLTAKILISALTGTDADSHTVTFDGASGVTTNGATVGTAG